MKQDDKIVYWIEEWLIEMNRSANTNGFIVGVSGGIDSAVVSTLCARTSLPTYVVNMPIHQNFEQLQRATHHIEHLENSFENVQGVYKDLTHLYDTFKSIFTDSETTEMSLANSKARLRMTTLYELSATYNCLVAGTGNKVEDYGVGFFAKYGDGGVDISPIGDLYKSDVYAVAKWLDVSDEIIQATPTDGLFEDNRTDEQQLTATYKELEDVMLRQELSLVSTRTQRQDEVEAIYKKLHAENSHKMKMPPICELWQRRSYTIEVNDGKI